MSYLDSMTVIDRLTAIHEGDVLEVLRSLPAECVQTIITSPPYFRLRDYHLPPTTWEDGQDVCLGREDTVEAYVRHLSEVFRAAMRVLRDDGTLWLNIGDRYDQAGNLELIPARVAIAMKEDGWTLRSEIVWAKGVSFCPTYVGRCMPEPVNGWQWQKDKDGKPVLRKGSWRPTVSHEKVFLFSRGDHYYADREAVAEPISVKSIEHYRYAFGGKKSTELKATDNPTAVVGYRTPTTGRNLRNVWTINTANSKDAHFAVFPEKLIRPMVEAATPEAGNCEACGSPFARVIELEDADEEWKRACGADSSGEYHGEGQKDYAGEGVTDPSALKARILAGMKRKVTTGWRTTCSCGRGATPSIVLDPFMGTGTTLMVAWSLGRKSIGIELSREYINIAYKRLKKQDED